MKDIASIRRNYALRQLDESAVDKDPIAQFGKWLDEALKSDILEPNAMILSTSTPEGKPSSRVVLLKQFDTNGFSFFTNYLSRKGLQLELNPFAALVFFWPELERQIRIEGTVTKVSAKESDEYFDSRPEGSKISSWVSPQSKPIPNRSVIETLKVEFQSQFLGKQIVRPENWGGYRLVPSLFEFWQGRPDRLHDRIQYSIVQNGWVIERLAP
jgi:pyridoxamine 5'-phosphate oxidase